MLDNGKPTLYLSHQDDMLSPARHVPLWGICRASVMKGLGLDMVEQRPKITPPVDEQRKKLLLKLSRICGQGGATRASDSLSDPVYLLNLTEQELPSKAAQTHLASRTQLRLFIHYGSFPSLKIYLFYWMITVSAYPLPVHRKR